MAMDFRYSCTIYGHTADVRNIQPSPIPGSTILSASRDLTARLWTEDSDGKGYHQMQSFEGHTNFVSCVAAVGPSEDYPEGLVFTGSSDQVIRIFLPSSNKAATELKGHTDTVCTLATGKFQTLISGSWDRTARVWIYSKGEAGTIEGKNVLKLEGHTASVWAVLLLQQGIMATGSGDKTIKLWKAGKCVQTFTGHEDCVRDLALISACQFLSCANDATVRRWTTTGECLQVYYGHTSFIYSIAVLPGETGFVSSGEDRTVRVWDLDKKDAVQTIALPAQSVWDVTILKNKDLITALSDSTMRIFTQSETRVASDPDIAAFEAELADSMTKKDDAISEVDEENVKDATALSLPGAKDGQVIMVRNGSKIEAHQWSENDVQWTKIGDVVSAKKEDKKTLNGQEYDFVFDVDIQEGVPTLKLPYNLDEDPWFAAQRFIDQNELSQDFLDEICTFIMDNTKEARKRTGQQPRSAAAADPLTGGTRYVPGASDPGSSGGVSSFDPFTGGGRYIPGETDSTMTNGSTDPFTGGGRYVPGSGDGEVKPGGGAAADPMINPDRYIPGDEDEKMETSEPVVHFVPQSKKFEPSTTTEYFPKEGFITFDSANIDAIIAKLKTFSEKCGPLGEADIDALKSLTVINDSTETTHLEILWKILNWPPEYVFPGLDILRLTCLRQASSSRILCAGTSDDDDGPKKLLDLLCTHISAPGNSKPESANRLLSIRVLCNLFESPDGAAFMVAGYKDVFQALSAGFSSGLSEHADSKPAPFYGNKNAQIAAASLLLNYSVLVVSAANSHANFSPAVRKLSSAVRSSCVEVTIVHLVTGEDLSDAEATFRYLVCLGTLISANGNEKWIKEARALGAEKIVETAGATYSSVGKIYECTKSLSVMLFE